MTTKNQSLVEKGFASYLPIALTAIIFAAVPGGLLGSMSIFFTHLAEDNMTVVSQVTIYLTAGALVLAFSGPIMGRLFAQHDLRIVGSVIVILIALSMFVLSVNTSIVQVWIAGALMHFLCLLGMGLLLPTLINRWFKDRAGAVLGLAAAFTGVGGAIFIQVGQAIIDASDYRTALLVYAVLCLVLTLPFMLFAIRSFPEEKGMLPYISSKHSDQTGSASSAVAAKNWSVDPSIATKSIPFVLVCVIVACANWTTQIASFFPTYINSLTAVGVTTFVTGATLATFTMVGQAICKVILGASVDFSPIKAVFAACGIGIVAILCVWLSPGSLLLPIGGFIFGMFYATPVVLSPLIGGAIFGTGKEYSVIWGRTMLPSNLLACPAGIVWPLLAENFGGFDVVFIGGILLILVFAFGATAAIKLGKKLPHIVPETPNLAPDNKSSVAK